MMTESNIKKWILILPILGVLLASVSLTYIFISQIKDHFEFQKLQLIHDEEENIKQIVKSRVDNTIKLLEKSYDQAVLEEKNEIKNTIKIAHNIINDTYNRNINLPNEKILEKIKQRLRDLKFYENGVGYYFIFTLDGTTVLHPYLSQYEGKNFESVPNLNSKQITNRFKAFLKAKDEGFLKWEWYKPDEPITKQKIGYIKKFEPLNIFIGSAKYKEDIYYSTLNKLQELLNIIRFNNQGYVFAYNHAGTTISHIKQELIDKNRWHLNLDGRYIVQEIIEKAQKQDGEILKYLASVNPKTNKPAYKISYVKNFDNFDWAIGSGIYTSFINDKIEVEKNILDSQLKDILYKVITLSIIITLITTSRNPIGL